MSISTSLAVDAATQVCPGCHIRQPLEDFAVIRFGVAVKCKKCEYEEKIATKITRLQHIASKTAIADLATMARQKIDSPHVSELCERLVKRFGGLDAFADFWYSQVMASAAAKPGSKVVLDACKSISNLINMSTEHRNSAPDVANLSDAELEREKARMIIELLVRDTSGEALGILREMDSGRLREENGALEADSGGAAATGEGHPPPV